MILFFSVVAKIKMACFGGSSSVFKKALKAHRARDLCNEQSGVVDGAENLFGADVGLAVCIDGGEPTQDGPINGLTHFSGEHRAPPPKGPCSSKLIQIHSG